MNEEFEPKERNFEGGRDDYSFKSRPSNADTERRPRTRIGNRQRVGTQRAYSYQDRGRSEGYRPRFNDGDDQPQRRFFTAYDNRRPNNNYRTGGGERRNFGAPESRAGEDGNRPYRSPGYNRPYGNQQKSYGGFQRDGYGKRKPQRRNDFSQKNKYSQKKRLEYKEENYDPNQPIRLNKYLANAGVCSRRDADKYIEAGVVTVNGVVVKELGSRVLRSDVVKFHDEPVKMEKKVYVLLNKPKGYVTTSEDPQNRKTVMDLVHNACPERIYPVGRLDRNTTGVLLLTNDGELASKLTHPQFLKKKIYHVHLDRNVTAADMRQIAEGLTLDDGVIKVDDVQYASDTDKKQVGIEIHSGRNRIVRRIFESLGYHVVKLDRVFFAGLTKKNVKRGDWRYLTQEEVNFLKMGAFE